MDLPMEEVISKEEIDKVNEIHDLVCKISSKDEAVAAEAFDKTVINSETYKETNGINAHGDEVSSFCKSMEKDAKERALRKEALRLKAGKYKEKANLFFITGDLDKAVEFYSKAIEICKDWPIIYTNRALAYIRRGSYKEALDDCDIVIRLHADLPAENQPAERLTVSKAYFRRGKALLGLGRPEESLEAYEKSLWFRDSNPSETCPKLSDNRKITSDFVEPIAQARSLIKAHKLDCLVGQGEDGPSDTQVSKFTSMVTTLASSSAKASSDAPAVVLEEASLFFQMARLLETNVGVFENKLNKRQRQRRNKSAQTSPRDDVDNRSQMQSRFRSNAGFKSLPTVIEALCDGLDFSTVEKTGKIGLARDSCPTKERNNLLVARLRCLQCLLDLLVQLTTEDAENCRLLAAPAFTRFFTDCVLLCIRLRPANEQAAAAPALADVHEVQLNAIMTKLCTQAAQLLHHMMKEATGRQVFRQVDGQDSPTTALLNHFAAGLACCLTAQNSRLNEGDHRTAMHIASCLEQAVQLPNFLHDCHKSMASFEALVKVIEAALQVTSESGMESKSIGVSAKCLSSLVDVLATACSDTAFRTVLLKRQPLLTAIAQRLSHHAPLLHDEAHKSLVGSSCRLLHNLCLSDAALSNSVLNRLLNGAGRVVDQPNHGPEVRAVCVAMIGRLLPRCMPEEIKSWCKQKTVTQVNLNNDRVSSAANPLLSMMNSQVEEENPRDIGKEPLDFHLTPRCQLLLDILDNTSVPLMRKIVKTPADEQTAHTNGHHKELSEDELTQRRLRRHMLHGCVRALAAIISNVEAVRFAIGDCPARSRKLARLLRAKDESVLECDSNTKSRAKCLGPEAPRYDEVLAGNACLALQHCIADTPLAEHLASSSVIADLLSLIRNSEKQDTRRNASILASKLSLAYPKHREELNRLDGTSILGRANCGPQFSLFGSGSL